MSLFIFKFPTPFLSIIFQAPSYTYFMTQILTLRRKTSNKLRHVRYIRNFTQTGAGLGNLCLLSFTFLVLASCSIRSFLPWARFQCSHFLGISFQMRQWRHFSLSIPKSFTSTPSNCPFKGHLFELLKGTVMLNKSLSEWTDCLN